MKTFLDQFLNRKVSQATRPSFLNDPRLASSVRGLHSPATSSRTTSTAKGLPRPRDSPSAPSWIQTYDNYADLPDESQALDLLLFQSLYTIVTGPYLSIITDLQGDDARYTYAIIAMWQHNAMGASSRRLNALNDMMDLQYVGDAGKWKLELMAKAREVYASDLTIEHFIMHCAFKSFEGKNTQVQAMMAEDINSNDGSDAFALEKLATKYSQFVATLTSAKVTQIHAATKDDRHKCSYCDRRGHKASACRDRLRAEADNDTETNKDSEGDQLDDDIEKCTYCKQPGHRASRCRKKLKDTKAAEKKAAEEQGTAPAVANLTPATVNALMSQPLTSHQIQSICKELTTGGPKIFSVMDDREAIDVKGDDRKILNNIEGDLSHEIRRGEVKILIDVKDDLPHEIRDVSTAEMQSDPYMYPDCMIRYILETLNAEEDIETLNVEDDTKTLNVEDDTKTLNVEDDTETLNVEEALVIL